jgi:arylsulfatase A-like enzyme
MPDMDRPNFLIVMTDHQRWDTTVPEHPCITPNLTKLAAEGVSFTHTYCPMAHCSPARATFFSGLYPTRTGVWNNVGNDYAIGRGPHEHVKMFSEDLREANYDLAYAGKWHVSALGTQTPKRYGWRELAKYGQTIQDGHQKWEQIRRTADDPGDPDAKIQMPGFLPHDLYGVAENGDKGDRRSMDLALAELPRLADGDKPWALYLGWNGPHAPYKIPQRYLDMYDVADVELPKSYFDDMADKPDYYGKLRRATFDQLGEERTKDAIRHFWAYCTMLDEMFGEVMAALEQTGQADNTVVLYCADHGDYVGEHGLFHKQVPSFLGGYRVPAIARWPKGVRNPGRRVEEFVSLADFAPTYLELGGVQPERYHTGRSLVPFLRDETPPGWRQEICMQCEGTEQHFTQRQVLTKTHKYVFNGFGRDELYDMARDPDEIVNQIDNPEHDEAKRDLVGRMWQFAYLEQDRLGQTQYIMVNTAPWGPKEGFRDGKGDGIGHAVRIGEENDPQAVRRYNETAQRRVG